MHPLAAEKFLCCVQYIRNVTDGIVDGVRQLQDLGVDSVLVNLLPPLGCDPWNTRQNNYTKCAKDSLTGVHNKHLTDKLGDDDSVLLLDLDTVFKSIIVPKTSKGLASCLFLGVRYIYYLVLHLLKPTVRSRLHAS
jgi:phospholipase/lecithinase/hemolysin